ncbi:MULTISPECIES: DUF2232 domain-containing protein [Atopobiaceae]|uniref:DUF2232 domain-containing protein n=1 Tax=Atopobiaceae TaxID=1643824 RepID=UPI001177DF86|nr:MULTISPECIES: DUF2232 domain-containing protein [Atopobiaceae]
MSEDYDSKRPVPPQGYERIPGGEVPEAKASGAQKRGDGQRLARPGSFWAVFGAAIAYASPNAGSLLASYGICRMGLGSKGKPRAILFASLLVPALLAAVLFDWSQLPYVVITCACVGFISWWGLDQEVSEQRVILLGVAISLCFAAVDACVAWMNGYTLPDVIEQVIGAYSQYLSGSNNIAAQTNLSVASDLIRQYWPMAYVINAIGLLVCSLVGASAALRKRAKRPVLGRLCSYDAPRWVAIPFVVSAALAVAAPHLGDQSSLADFVGRNGLAASRIVLALQGVAVADWYARKLNVGSLLRGILAAALIWAEVSFVVPSVLGLVDLLAANFRDLDRGRRTVDKAAK